MVGGGIRFCSIQFSSESSMTGGHHPGARGPGREGVEGVDGGRSRG